MAQLQDPVPQKVNKELKKKKKKKKKDDTVSFEMSYECQASSEMMIKIFTMREQGQGFLKAVFYGQIKPEKDTFVIGDNRSFVFKIDKEYVSEDEEHILEMSWHKKEWEDDDWSKVTLTFSDDDEVDRKCDLEFKQTGIPLNDKHGNSEQGDAMKIFWQRTIFKGLTQFGNIGCKEQQ